MKKEITIQEIDMIIYMADQLKIQATGLRKKLVRFHAPAPKGGNKRPLTLEQETKLILRRERHLKKKIS